MNVVSKTFRSGNSVAVRLPKQFGVEAGTEVVIERTDGGLTIRRTDHAAVQRERLSRLVADLRALGGPIEIEQREPFEFPERPGLV